MNPADAFQLFLSYVDLAAWAIMPSFASRTIDGCLPSPLLLNPHFFLLLYLLLTVGAAQRPPAVESQGTTRTLPRAPYWPSYSPSYLDLLQAPQYLSIPQSLHIPSWKLLFHLHPWVGSTILHHPPPCHTPRSHLQLCLLNGSWFPLPLPACCPCFIRNNHYHLLSTYDVPGNECISLC